MFKVRGKLIVTPEIDVIYTLRNELHKRGIYKLAKVKKLKNNIQINCPIHDDGKEKNPSCGIKIGDNAGIVNCFTCGYGKGNAVYIDDFVSHCFGFNDRGRYGADWLLKNFVVGIVNEREPIKRIERISTKEKIKSYITESELDMYRFIHPYHYERGLTDEIIELFDVGYDEKTDCLTFPVYDIDGNCVFIARRGVKQKYFNYPDDIEKPVYGMHLIDNNTKEVIVCESILNALTCWIYGKKAVALLGTGSKEQMEILKKLPVKKIIIAMDGDNPGTQAIGRLRTALKNSRKLISEYNLPCGKDINNLTKNEFLSLREYY